MASKSEDRRVVKLDRKFLLDEVVRSLQLPSARYAYLKGHNGARVPYVEVFYEKPDQDGKAKSKKVFGKSQIAGGLNYDFVCEKAIEFLKSELNAEIRDISHADKWKIQVEQMYSTKEVDFLRQENIRLKELSLDLEDGWRKCLEDIDRLSTACKNGFIIRKGNCKEADLYHEFSGGESVLPHVRYGVDRVSYDLHGLYIEGVQELFGGAK